MISRIFNIPDRRSTSSNTYAGSTISGTSIREYRKKASGDSILTTVQQKDNIKQKRNKEELLHGKEEVVHIDVEQQNRYSSRNAVVLDEADVKTVVFKLSNTEKSFLPREVQRRLANRAGQLPPSPSIYPGTGAALFVDISGFTALGDYLRKTCKTPKEAASLLAQRITHVISLLTKICLNFNGDVAKFAGDAILCIWDEENNNSGNQKNREELSRSESCDDALNQAKACALEMLQGIERFNQSTSNSSTGSANDISLADHKLQIHGGIAVGSILHFHLGSLDDKLRSYLVAGEAIFGATEVVSMAGPGEFVVIKDRLYAPIRSPQMSLATFTVGRGSDLGSRNARSRKSGKMKLSAAIGGSRASIGLSPATLAELQRTTSSKLGDNGETRTLSIGTSPSIRSEENLPPSDFAGLATITEGDDDGNPRKSNLALAKPRANTLRRTSNLTSSSTLSRLVAVSSNFFSKSGRMLTLGSIDSGGESQQQQKIDQLVNIAPTLPENLVHDKLTISTILNNIKTRGRIRTESDPALRDGIPRNGNVYIPKSLRKGFRTGFSPSEMRDKVAIVFVGLEDLSLSEPEIQQNQINDEKLDSLNSAFVKMTRITHSFDGEVRDLLFDDKGCVFISVFGALNPLEHPGLNAVKSAIAIMNEIGHARIGVSMGTVFVGMCGTPKRQDFVVMGHEVNMSARYMSNADPGTIIVSPIIYENAKESIKFTEETVYFGKATADDPDGMDIAMPDGNIKRLKRHRVYKPDMSITARPSFLAQYKYSQVDKDLFIGRMTELHRIEVLLANNMGLDPLTIGDTGAPSGRASFTTGGTNSKKEKYKTWYSHNN